MAHYRTGTISLTNGSASITGVGTDFVSGAAVGECVSAPDGKLYEIASIQSATALTLGTVYLGATASGQSYSIVPTQSYIRDLAAQAATLVNNYGTAMTTAGAGKFDDGTLAIPGVRFNADENTGIRRTGADAVALVTGGVDRVTVSAAGAIGIPGTLAVTGVVTGPTAAAGINTTQLATTAHVFAERTNAATLTNKTLTAPAINSPTGIVKADVGLGNVDNTTDAAKPVSTAQQTALNLKADLASPVLTGTPTAPTAALGTNTTQLATTAFVQQEKESLPAVAAALHRSPNAVTAMFIYDTSKDSDGGAWTEKCQHTSWYNEALSGKWLGANASELLARLSGAIVGPELIANGTFTTDTSGWTAATTTLSIVSGTLQIDAANGTAHQDITTEIGATYVLTFDVPYMVGGYLHVGTTVSPKSLIDVAIGATGSQRYIFVATAVTTRVRWQTSSAAGLRIDDVSTKKVTAQTTTSGDYFQSTGDGKFYKLNAGSGVTEVFRGNKRAFPKLAGIVAEAANVTIYDLTEAGRPMWMRFKGGANALFGSLMVNWASVGQKDISSVAASNGRLLSGSSTSSGAAIIIDFAKDKATTIRAEATYGLLKPTIVDRNTGSGAVLDSSGFLIASSIVNAVAMTVLPDAPIDPVTGLAIPHIAVFTAGGISLIRDNGTVINSSSTTAFTKGTIDAKQIMGVNSTGALVSAAPRSLAASFALTSYLPSTAPALNGVPTVTAQGKSRAFGNASGVTLLKENIGTVAKGTAARIGSTFNSGWQNGNTVRAYLADIGAGSVGPSTELVTNGTFASPTTDGWASTGAGTFGVVAEKLEVTAAAAVNSGAYYAVNTVIGKPHWLSIELTLGSATICDVLVTPNGLNTALQSFNTYQTANGVKASLFIPTTAISNIRVMPRGVGLTASVDNISVKEVIPDRSYKAQGATIVGTLTKTEVALAAQTVAYSGFSAANYLQEPYSSDLNFGTGEWSVGAWVNAPTGNAAAATISAREGATGAYIRLGIDATNKLTATAYDGTTTRTVTTTAAYNTATWLKAEATYKAGKLAILVNGVEATSTNGAPLLTLNNASAVLTIGNSYALDAPFPGSIALLKIGATVPTTEQAAWMYEQEKHMFTAGAQVCLPDANAIVDLAYDDATDKWIAVSTTNESEWSGLVRTSTKAVPSGAYSKVSATSGVKMYGRTTTTPGVDIEIPAYGLREQVLKRDQRQDEAMFDFLGGFTATTNITAGTSYNLTSVAASLYPTSYVGAVISGSGIPASTAVVGVSGTTIYMSAAATIAASAVQISFTDFILPVGYEARTVYVDGVMKYEGATRDFTRLFDGFKETIRFGVAPAYNAKVQIQSARSAA